LRALCNQFSGQRKRWRFARIVSVGLERQTQDSDISAGDRAPATVQMVNPVRSLLAIDRRDRGKELVRSSQSSRKVFHREHILWEAASAEAKTRAQMTASDAWVEPEAGRKCVRVRAHLLCDPCERIYE
jgi:hypothetical protein